MDGLGCCVLSADFVAVLLVARVDLLWETEFSAEFAIIKCCVLVKFYIYCFTLARLISGT